LRLRLGIDPDTDLSILSSSIHPGSIEGSTEGSKKAAYTTWEHTRPARDGEDQFYKKAPMKYCIYCIEPSYGTSVTTNMRNHLKSRHQILIEKAPATQATIIGQRALYQDTIDRMLVSLIVLDNLSFRLVESPRFRTFCNMLNSESDDFIIRAHSSVPKKIKQL
jgi:hypothetical protein